MSDDDILIAELPVGCEHCGDTIKVGQKYKRWEWCEEHANTGCDRGIDDPDLVDCRTKTLRAHVGCIQIWNEVSDTPEFNIGELASLVLDWVEGNRNGRMEALSQLANCLRPQEDHDLPDGANGVLHRVATTLHEQWLEDSLDPLDKA